MQPGGRVRRASTDEVGVVISVDGDYADVGFGAQTLSVHLDDLVLLPSGPLETLAAGTVGTSEAFDLRLRGLYLRHAYRFDELSGLSNARIEPAFHQVYIAHRVNQKLYPRIILADEVGLGKTIEAGLVIKELRARELIDRVLIVCPANLGKGGEMRRTMRLLITGSSSWRLVFPRRMGSLRPPIAPVLDILVLPHFSLALPESAMPLQVDARWVRQSLVS